ncbi:MAG: hypothetical protein K0S27_832 [Gammaproteobacteria bacterium]|jgi:hypothetical protein|nr:hypothetical protein [Gammaproteobacteria bacterium]
MEKLNMGPEKLAHVQKNISLHLTRITRLQELLRREEVKLYSCLQEEKILKTMGSVDNSPA